jgi:hypothetical protein
MDALARKSPALLPGSIESFQWFAISTCRIDSGR